MKRIIRKHWDQTNGCLVANLFKVYGEDTVQVISYRSPIMLSNADEAKGKMFRYGEPHWCTRAQAETILSVLDKAKEK